MIVVMKAGASQSQVDVVVEHIEALGLRSHIIVGTELTVVAALGEKRDGARQALETIEGVDKVVPILAPYKMASTEVKKEPTVVRALDLKVGGGHIGVIAGPCSVESRSQILDGIERISPDGTIIFAEEQMSILDNLLGYHCRQLQVADARQAATELRTKYERFLERIGSPQFV